MVSTDQTRNIWDGPSDSAQSIEGLGPARIQGVEHLTPHTSGAHAGRYEASGKYASEHCGGKGFGLVTPQAAE
ncbi:hypothetical protein M8818_006002 [Zalaria obscura]|uniref:Uncharacterized protein n=1 Tax=Zalaria obscura TaxID=2024903 RepID=A0ACC3S6R2_9PEZI